MKTDWYARLPEVPFTQLDLDEFSQVIWDMQPEDEPKISETTMREIYKLLLGVSEMSERNIMRVAMGLMRDTEEKA